MLSAPVLRARKIYTTAASAGMKFRSHSARLCKMGVYDPDRALLLRRLAG
jgi:hypothetical protein